MVKYLNLSIIGFLIACSGASDAQTLGEAYLNGGSSIGLNNGGAVGLYDLSNVDSNPALLARKREYIFSGNMTTVPHGEGFFDLGIIDSHTSEIAMGLKGRAKSETKELTASESLTTSVENRYSIAFAKKISKIYAGIGANYAKAMISEELKFYEVEVLSMNVGLAGQLSKSFSWGFSWQNLNNRGFHQLSPYTFRAGASYKLLPTLDVIFDYVSVKVPVEDQNDKTKNRAHFGPGLKWEVLKGLNVLAATAWGVGAEKTSSLSGGISYKYNDLELSYFAMKSKNKGDLTSSATLSYTARTL